MWWGNLKVISSAAFNYMMHNLFSPFPQVLITKCIVRDPAQTVQQQLRHIEDYALERLNPTMYEDFLLLKLFSTKRETVLQKIETNLKSTTDKVFMNIWIGADRSSVHEMALKLTINFFSWCWLFFRLWRFSKFFNSFYF